MNPKLSIVITTRNRPEELKTLLYVCDLDSATARRIEVIVVDDNSDDESQFAAMQAVSDFLARTGLGQYEYLTDRRFPGGARNRGLDLASGEYVWIVDGDDMVNWCAIPRILVELDGHPNVPLLMLDYSSTTNDIPEDVQFSGHELRPWECGVTVWNKVVRRDIFERFREGVFCEDVDWWMRMCLNPDVDGYLAPGICAYTYSRRVPGSVTATGEDKTEGAINGLIDELWKIIKIARSGKRPTCFVHHLIWLIYQYEMKIQN